MSEPAKDMSVTDTKSATGEIMDSRNEEPTRSLDEIGAELNRLFDAMDPRSDEEKRVWKLIYNSAKRAEICANCERPIGESELVYRVRVTSPSFLMMGAHGSVIAVLCRDCGDKVNRYFLDAKPCEYCQRPVRNQLSQVFVKHVVCSNQCRAPIDAAQARERRIQLAANRKSSCETCHRNFTPKRADTKHCSPACKQKAYRQRCFKKEAPQ